MGRRLSSTGGSAGGFGYRGSPVDTPRLTAEDKPDLPSDVVANPANPSPKRERRLSSGNRGGIAQSLTGPLLAIECRATSCEKGDKLVVPNLNLGTVVVPPPVPAVVSQTARASKPSDGWTDFFDYGTPRRGVEYTPRGQSDEDKTIAREVCATYVENNVSPLLKIVQQAQEMFSDQLKSLKATAAEEREVLRAEVGAIRTELVVTKDLLETERKMRQEEVAALRSQLSNLNVATPARERGTQLGKDVQATVEEQKALREEMASLRAEMRASTCDQSRDASQDEKRQPSAADEVGKVKVLFAAVGAKFNKQIKEMKKELLELQEQQRDSSASDRWPGRVLEPAVKSDAGSDGGSDVVSLSGSMGGSVSLAGFGNEEKAELRKVQAVVCAAGTAFSKEFRDVRRQIQSLRDEIHIVKDCVKA